MGGNWRFSDDESLVTSRGVELDPSPSPRNVLMLLAGIG